MWYGLVDPASGDLVSVGTVSLFPDGNHDAFMGVYDVVEFGPERPNFSAYIWSPSLRRLIDRPLPVVVSRLDDFEALLVADADFGEIWANLNEQRRTKIRLGLRRVLGRLLGHKVSRLQDEPVEL